MILQLRANAVSKAASTDFLLRTGSVPGMAESKKETKELAGDAKLLADPERSFELVLIWACISNPITLSQFPDLENQK